MRILGVIFLGVIKWIQYDIFLLLPLTVQVNKNVKKSASVGQTRLWNPLVRAASSVWIQSTMFGLENDIQGQMLFYGVVV